MRTILFLLFLSNLLFSNTIIDYNNIDKIVNNFNCPKQNFIIVIDDEFDIHMNIINNILKINLPNYKIYNYTYSSLISFENYKKIKPNSNKKQYNKYILKNKLSYIEFLDKLANKCNQNKIYVNLSFTEVFSKINNVEYFKLPVIKKGMINISNKFNKLLNKHRNLYIFTGIGNVDHYRRKILNNNLCKFKNRYIEFYKNKYYKYLLSHYVYDNHIFFIDMVKSNNHILYGIKAVNYCMEHNCKPLDPVLSCFNFKHLNLAYGYYNKNGKIYKGSSIATPYYLIYYIKNR